MRRAGVTFVDGRRVVQCSNNRLEAGARASHQTAPAPNTARTRRIDFATGDPAVAGEREVTVLAACALQVSEERSNEQEDRDCAGGARLWEEASSGGKRRGAEWPRGVLFFVPERRRFGGILS